jgi:uncharacterized membrane protein
MERKPAVVIKVAVPTTTGAYSSGQCVGGLLTIPNAVLDSGASAKVVSVTVMDKAKQKIAADLFFLSGSPGTAPTDKAAADIASADRDLALGSIQIPAGNYADLANCAVGTAMQTGLLVKPSTKNTKDLYAFLVTRGTPTYGANGITLEIGIEQN